MKNPKIIFSFVFLMISLHLLSLEIFGKVFSESREPLENVVVAANKKAVISNAVGYFRMRNVLPNERIKFHKIGFKDTVFTAKKMPEKIFLHQKSIEINGMEIIAEKSDDTIFSKVNKIVIPVSGNNSASAADILRNNAALNLRGIRLGGEKQTISVAGNLPRHTLVMLDGIPLNAAGGDFDISTIPAKIIAHIEILENCGSSFAGSGAIGGVVNIVTRGAFQKQNEKSKFVFSLQQTEGSFGFSKTEFSADLNNRNLQISALISNEFARNNFTYKYNLADSTEWKTRQNNEKFANGLNLRISHHLLFFDWSYHLIWQRFHKDLPGPINALSMNDCAHLDGKTYRNFLNLSHQIGTVSWKSDLYYFDELTRFENTESTVPNYNIIGETKYGKQGGKLTASSAKNDFLSWQSGIEFKREDFQYSQENSPAASILSVFLKNSAIFAAANSKQRIFPFMLKEEISIRYDHPQRSDELNFADFLSWKTYLRHAFSR